MATKGSRLKDLSQNGFREFILPMCVVTRKDASKDFLELQVLQFQVDSLAVRSSAPDEDQELSNAGRYLTLLNVNKKNLYTAAIQVLDSYETKSDSDELLIQPFLSHTTRSGVVFTRCPETNSNYYIVNSSSGQDTTTITSGTKNGRMETIYSPLAFSIHTEITQRNSNLLQLVKKVSDYYHDIPLDIEFAEIDRKVVLLQVRPLKIIHSNYTNPLNDEYLVNICRKINSWKTPKFNLLGETTAFGIMPDWNPAEIIGVRPRPLALSLFKELITDSVWAQGRALLGYRDISSESILVEIAGQPYVNLRNSFNSLIPKTLDPDLGRRIIDFYLNKLVVNPHLHDKIESEIVLSSYTFDIQERIAELPTHISDVERNALKNALTKLTKDIICGSAYGLKEVFDEFRPLEIELVKIQDSRIPFVDKIRNLVSVCKKHGTIPFASAARLAFIGTELVNSLARKSLISSEISEKYFNSIHSVSSEFLTDWSGLTSDEFLEKYRHLRPGTYDIRVPTYGEAFNQYFNLRSGEKQIRSEDSLVRQQMLEKLTESEFLKELDVTADNLLDFVERAIKSREIIKFSYTKVISLILDLISGYADRNDFSKEDASYFNIKSFLDFEVENCELKSKLMDEVETGRVNYSYTEAISLPPLIFNDNDIFSFETPDTYPNFVTHNAVTGNISQVGSHQNLVGKILLIENADPGFDWIFTRGILGFITCYGGANSHMAVRARELNLPAALGVGREAFNKLTSAKYVFLDCLNKRIDY